MTRFQSELRELRALRTQHEFANDLGVSRATVAQWEAGNTCPSIALARKLVAHGMDPRTVMAAVTTTAKGSAA